jgi:GDP-L-fucose synthase
VKILILGSNGLVGSSLVRVLSESNLYEIFKANRSSANLFNLNETKELIENFKPNVVINAAAKVGGIVANNTNRTEFILENLKININVLESLIPFPNIKLINLGSSCIYPLGTEIPIVEEKLMTGKLEPTNSPYAMAKLTSIEMGNALKVQYGHKIINLMPTNLYGPNDSFSEVNSHVIPGLIYRMNASKINTEEKFKVWGTGNPLREFLYVDDLADAINFIIQNNIEEEILNVGSGEEVSIRNLVKKVKEIINYEGELYFDSSIPDGNPRKLLDSSKINSLGWQSKIGLDDGLVNTYDWFKKNISQ